jgi:hypothetical protein
MYVRIVKRCSCGLTYTQEEWARLPLVGPLLIPAGKDPVLEPEEQREMRNCVCGSTISILKSEKNA